MATPNIVPRADSEGQLGTSSKYWAAAYIDVVYVGAGKIGRDADNLLDFSIDNNIVFKVNGANELQLNSAEFFPYTSDGLSLGNTGRMWSDLFLASGAVINFDNGNVTLTHSSGKLTLADSDQICFGGGNDLQIFHNGNSSIDNYTGNLTISNTSNGDDLIFKCDNGSGGLAEYFRLDGSAVRTISSQHISMNDGKALYVGDGLDAGFYHSGGHNFLETNSGDLTIVQNTDDGDILFQSDNGSGGVATYFTVDGGDEIVKYNKNIKLQDSVVLNIGSGNDLQIFHDGSHSHMVNLTGNLRIRNFADDSDITFESDDGAGGTATYFYLDGSSATHDGSATTGLYTNWPDNSRISLGTSHDFSMRHDGTNTVLNNNTGDLYFMQSSDGKDIIFQSDDGSSGVATYLALDGSDVIMKAHKSLRFLDSAKGTFGNNDDLQIYHDGSNSYIDEVGTGDLIISADNDLKFMDRGNNIMANMNAANSVELYFGGVKKLETKSTGIAVTGGVTSTSASGNAAGAGFNTSGTVAIDVGEINGEIITTIKVDLGTGAIVSSGTAGDVIGEDDTEGAFLTRITTAVNGIVYRGEMICVEVPTTGDPDINLAANSSSTLAEDGAGEGEHVLINGGTATLAKHYPSFTIPSGGIQNDHLYLTHGGTTAGTYGAGQFIIKLYGAAVVS